MATYKVPQDVEADDKLIGPFSFRQFIYLLIVAGAIAIAWGLSRLFVGLAIIPLPVIVFFGALALPLRKDQPMEIYLAAMVSFYLKPHRRLWDPEGIETLIEITAPKVVEVQRTKDLSQNEAERRLSYLADIVDSQGWAIRGVGAVPGTAMNNDIYLEAQGATDVLDTNTAVAHTFDQMMSQSTERMREEARQRMVQATQPQPPVAPPNGTYAIPSQPQAQPSPQPIVQPSNLGATAPVGPAIPPHYNPYPTIHQAVIQPLNDVAHQAVNDIVTAPATPATTPADDANKAQNDTTTSDAALTAGIMNLANNPDLSIETIAHEAQRLHKKAEESEEVVISLR
ncbi:MAG TPA: PrgI family protein [Dongiaceae bacterium]|nr:PrgI family protein [Dongiaceae bacterium]